MRRVRAAAAVPGLPQRRLQPGSGVQVPHVRRPPAGPPGVRRARLGPDVQGRAVRDVVCDGDGVDRRLRRREPVVAAGPDLWRLRHGLRRHLPRAAALDCGQRLRA
eukprot:6021441-Prymnesium_polylepis.1